MEVDPKTICDNCIHDEVCGCEGHLEPALQFCRDKISTDTLSIFQHPRMMLRLSELIPYLNIGNWFTVIAKTGEPNNDITYIYPERFRVLNIQYDEVEKKISVAVEEI